MKPQEENNGCCFPIFLFLVFWLFVFLVAIGHHISVISNSPKSL